MTVYAYYNEIDPYAAQWLRNAMREGLIAPGYVDERSIEDVLPDDLKPFAQCHFFAGIGIWSVALRRIGWPDDRPIWSMSCPCQPFSAAGKGAGCADERHLWPAAFHLVTHLRPERIVGEQVASADGIRWLDLVQSDLEGFDYAPRAVPFPAAGVGAPNLRDRTYWCADRLADAGGQGQSGRGVFGPGQGDGPSSRATRERLEGFRPDGGVADAHHPQRGPGSAGRDNRNGPDAGWPQGSSDAEGRGDDGGVADTHGRDASDRNEQRSGEHGQQPQDGSARVVDNSERPGPVNGAWRNADWLFCRDGRWRPVRPGSFVLAHGVTNRASKLRAAGNAINLEAATAFLTAVALADDVS